MAPHDSNEQRQSAQEETATAMTVAPSPTSHPPQSAKGIGKLPVELMLNIAGHLGAAELNSLALSCRGLNSLLTPLLYKQNVQEQNSSAVLWACEHNSIDTLERLRQAGAQFDFVTERPPRRLLEAPVRFCPIHVAAKHGHVNVLAWLLDHGAGIGSLSQGVCDCRSVPFHRSGREHSPFPDPEWSALHLATCSGHTNAAIFLIERGAPLIVSQTTDEYIHTAGHGEDATTNVTVLHTAAAANNVALIDYIVERDLVDLETYDHRRYPAFLYAAAGAHSVGALARLDQLLGGPVETVGYFDSPVCFAFYRGAFACAVYLLKAGYRHNFGFSLIPHAAEMAYSPQWDATSLSIWTRQRDTLILELLARGHSAVPHESECVMSGSTSVLHLFAEKPPARTTPSLFTALIAAGCPADIPNSRGLTPLQLLAHSLKDIPDSDPDWQEVRESVRATILLLLQHHNARLFTTSSPDGKTPLDALLGTESRLPAWRQALADEVLQWTLNEKYTEDWCGRLLRQNLDPVLSECVEAGRVDACRILVKHGAQYRVIGVDAKARMVRKALGVGCQTVRAVAEDDTHGEWNAGRRWDGIMRDCGRGSNRAPVAKPEVLEALACCVSAAEMGVMVWQARNLSVEETRAWWGDWEYIDERWVWTGLRRPGC